MGNGEDIERATDEEIVNYFTENSVSMYLKEIMSYPVNNAQVNKDLIVKYKNGDIKAREMMIKGNLRLVVNVAYRYRNRITHMNILDIIQEGNIGLIRAIESYDPEISSFSNYAIWWIKQAITRGIDNQEKEIRKPIHFIEKKNKYLKFLSSLEKMGKEIPTDEEICQKLGLTLNDLLAIRKNDSTVTVSINSKVKED
ncbi:MAG TPA: sigma-70 family RNA polymerase sigma factor, partial [Candidatus Coprovivens excrementavium]|nr:sigma-70 family RNA polymerase sigma factor [Candidatus Coprovivens excrementavium]